MTRDHALRIVVSLHHEHPDVFAAQQRHLLAHKQACVKVQPVAVIQVTGQQYKIHLLLDGQVHQTLQRPTRSTPQSLQWGTLVPAQATQWAVNVQISRMNKTHI